MMKISSEETASITRRVFDAIRSTMNAIPAFSPRASALAAPKKLEPTISPRATSSDHSTGALNTERNTTEPITTARSAASSTAATVSVTLSSSRIGRNTPTSASDVAVATFAVSDACRLDFLDDWLGFRMLLDKIFGLHRDALAECGLVTLAHAHAFLFENANRFLLHGEPVRAGIGRRLLRRADEPIAHFRVHALEGRLTEIDRERREVMLRQ